MEKKYRPFKRFGEKLRVLRVQAKESLLEVSGAVEIDESTLKEIELGKKLPDEDILILLMNHFGLKDQEAVDMWELAGYSNDDVKTMNDEQLLKQIMMVIPVDNRVAYSDSAHISANKNGLVVDFTLAAGHKQAQTVSRVGMGLEQAEALVKDLLRIIAQAREPKVVRSLPAPKQRKKSSN